MPRGPRLDAPGVVHHVMARGIEQGNIFRSDEDRSDFVRRLARLLPDTQTTCLAWCLLSNHLHLVLRSGPQGLAHLMRRLLTGYAGAFNRRYGRAGHLFQNRYRSLICEEDLYLLVLVRYVHLNPIRAGLVLSVKALADYPWCGHGALVGRGRHAWQETAEVLERFGQEAEQAGRAYVSFVAEGLEQEQTPERRTGASGRELTRVIKEATARSTDGVGSTTILGSPEFTVNLRSQLKQATRRESVDCQTVVDEVCRVLGLSPKALASRRRTRPLSNGRAVVAYVARTRYHISCADLADALGTSAPAITLAERRGARLVMQRIDLRTGLKNYLIS
ncbi:MAG: transposase [Nitrospirota bacterium]